MLDAVLYLLLAVGFAAPAVNLGPAGDARLHSVSREITIHRLVVRVLGGLGIDCVRTRSDQGQIADEDDIKELRQLVEACLANETSDPGHARVVPADLLGRIGVSELRVDRAKLVDFDELVVEAITPLLEKHRALAFELDGERNQ